MLSLKSLTFSGIGRFVDEQKIDFTALGSLVRVDAQNLNNTRGSSGAGKSTIFKALEFLLGLNDISNGILQSRLTKDAMSVTGIFDLDGQPLRIERGKKLLIDLNGEVTTGSSKLTEEKLDQIIGMPRDLFRKILHKRQGEGGFFLDMGASETHKFLTSCLSLEAEQVKVAIVDSELDTLFARETSYKSSLESNKTGLLATQNAIASLGSSPVQEVYPEAIEGLKAKHLEAIETYKLVKEALKKESDDLEKSRPQIVSVPFDRSKIESLEKQIADTNAQIAQFEKAEQNRQSEVKAKISELQIQSSKLANSELTRQSDVKNKISGIRVEIAKIQGAEQNRQAVARSMVSALRVELIKSQNTVALGKKAKEDATVLAKELQKVRSAICPTCEQGWITDTCKAKEDQILISLSECKKVAVAGTEASSKITLINEQIQSFELEAQPRATLEVDALNASLNTLKEDLAPRVVPEVVELSYQIEHLKREAQPQPIPEVASDLLNRQQLTLERKAESDHQFSENAKSQAILVEFAQKQTSLRQSHENTISAVRYAEEKALIELGRAREKAKYFEESKKRFDESLTKLNEQSYRYQYDLQAIAEFLHFVQEEIELAQEAKKAIKSYLSCSFEDALDSIGEQATKFIKSIPNMSNATVQFEGLKETQQGKIKEEVNCIISMDGEIGIPVKSLSGGERSSTDLAIDLAVIKFIEERTGKGIDLFVLDEPFTGLDPQNIIEALEMLRECSTNKRLLIVDHNAEAAQFMENRMTVIRDGQTSRVVQ